MNASAAVSQSDGYADIVSLMRGIRVDPAGLEAWSAQCATAAAELAAGTAVRGDLPSGQATAAAVAASQSVAAAAAEVLATRVQATGATASSAASSYVATDGASAQQLAEVAQGSGRVV